jgi:Zn-dependent M28 family amino/carboxypeptidase
MEGRRVGTAGEARAARYIAERMREAGLEPGGDSGYFQRLPLAQPAGNGRAAGREARPPVLLSSFAAWDSVPAERRRTAANVIGVLRGGDPQLANEVVVVGAHFDHEGIGAPLNGDSIYNGADDDASGTVAVLEAARLIAAGPRPKRTIVFAAFTGEEAGTLGVRWYVDHPIRPLAQHVADIQIEMIGRPDSLAGGPGRGWLTGFERSTMGEALAASGLPIVADARPVFGFFERSDNIVFARRGVVAHTLSSYNLHVQYHTPLDDVDLVDFDHVARLINVLTGAVRVLADGPAPVWKPGGRPNPGSGG